MKTLMVIGLLGLAVLYQDEMPEAAKEFVTLLREVVKFILIVAFLVGREIYEVTREYAPIVGAGLMKAMEKALAETCYSGLRLILWTERSWEKVLGIGKEISELLYWAGYMGRAFAIRIGYYIWEKEDMLVPIIKNTGRKVGEAILPYVKAVAFKAQEIKILKEERASTMLPNGSAPTVRSYLCLLTWVKVVVRKASVYLLRITEAAKTAWIGRKASGILSAWVFNRPASELKKI